MHIPTKLEEWTYDAVVGLAKLGLCEGERHDFKFDLPDPHNLTKVCCAFANSQGGFVVVGVKDLGGSHEVRGIDPNAEIAKKFSDKLKAVPSIAYASPKILTIPGSLKVLYVFHVYRSADRPHIPQLADHRFFWKRTPGGCEQMNYDEIQEQFTRLEERREKLKLLYIELSFNQESLKHTYSGQADKYSLVTLDSSILDRLLVDIYSAVQNDRRLMDILLSLRFHIRVTNAKAQIFFSQVALPTTNQSELVAKHNDFMEQKSKILLPLISEATEILEKRFGLKDPFADDHLTGRE